MNETWTRRAIGCSSSVCVRAKLPQSERVGVLVVCSMSSSASTALKAPVAPTRSATRRVTWSNMASVTRRESGRLPDTVITPRSAALLRHFADLRDGSHGDVTSRPDKERLFAQAVVLIDPYAHRALDEI